MTPLSALIIVLVILGFYIALSLYIMGRLVKPFFDRRQPDRDYFEAQHPGGQ